MALSITTTAATPIGLARAIRITVNTGFTGNLTVVTAGSTQYGTTGQTFTIVNPITGQTFAYGGLHEQGIVTITAGAACDLAVTKVNKLS